MGASSRYRFFQFFSYLEKENFEIVVYPLFNKQYIQNLYSDQRAIQLLNPINSYLKRTLRFLFNQNYDLIWMEKEAFPWLPVTIEKFLLKSSIPLVIDYDDAIYHRYDQHHNYLIRAFLSNKIKKIMSLSTVVIAGNKYIAEYAREAEAKRVKILPTVVDTKDYTQKIEKRGENFNIGWIGSPSTSRHINVVSSALNQLCKNSDVQFLAIGALEKDVANIPGQLIPWQERTESRELTRFDIGIMPLPKTPWERGKCGFKLIQYMACGLPVIASPVGVNREIVDHGVNGFLADNTDEWIEYLKALKLNPDLCRKMGVAGRQKVENEYSLQTTAPKLVKLLKKTVRG
jgi:glycosyltransferase involved in cell wall biosynthesis